MKRHYLAGPMSGHPQLNHPAFALAAEHLRALGHDIVSAHEVDHGEHTGKDSQPWTEYLRGDLRTLLTCNAIVLLPGWEQSRGAMLELHIAEALGFDIYLYHGVYGLQARRETP